MLVITRKAGQRIVMNKVITITVLAAKGDRIKLGFDAPADVQILREELLDEARENRESPAPKNAPLHL